jgi:hypothetical protein
MCLELLCNARRCVISIRARLAQLPVAPNIWPSVRCRNLHTSLPHTITATSFCVAEKSGSTAMKLCSANCRHPSPGLAALWRSRYLSAPRVLPLLGAPPILPLAVIGFLAVACSTLCVVSAIVNLARPADGPF